jgi:hypothetical protein
MEVAYAKGASWLPEDERVDARNLVETIGNLLYLMNVDAQDPAMVRSYVAQAEDRLRVLQALVPGTIRAHTSGPKLVPFQSSLQDN